LEEAKDVWTTLRLAHKGSEPMRKAKIDMLEGQVNRFVISNDETPSRYVQSLEEVGQQGKGLGSKKWTDHMLTEHMMRAYTPINYNMVALICQDPAYKRMSSDDVLGRIMNHEIYIEEANHVKNLSKGITTTRKQEITFKANKESKNKQEVVESPSEEEEEEDSSECDDENMALFMKKFKRYIKKKKQKETRSSKPQPREQAIIVVSMVTLFLIVPLSVGMTMMTRRSTSHIRRTRATKEATSPIKISPLVKLTLGKNGSSKMRAPTPIVMV
jgi:hypothetical protein